MALVGASIGFGWVVVGPFIGAIFWAVVLAILLAPLYRRLLIAIGPRETPAALATLLAAGLGLGVPLALIAIALAGEARALYGDLASGRLDFGAYVHRIITALPPTALSVLERLGVADFAAVQERLAAAVMAATRFVAAHMLGFGLDTADFALAVGVMLYLLFFLLRDGASVAARVLEAMPLAPSVKQRLAQTFVTLVRATVKGGVAMAAVQGILGGAMLGWLGVQSPLFWGVLFGLLSMVPAVGAGLLWGPIALFFLLTGAAWKALVLTIFGTVVLTLVDNILRPILVGRDAHLPGYLILLATLGGLATFGLNGVVAGPLIAAISVVTWRLWSRRNS